MEQSWTFNLDEAVRVVVCQDGYVLHPWDTGKRETVILWWDAEWDVQIAPDEGKKMSYKDFCRKYRKSKSITAIALGRFDKCGGVMKDKFVPYERPCGVMYTNIKDPVRAKEVLDYDFKLLCAWTYQSFFSVMIEKRVPACACCKRGASWEEFEECADNQFVWLDEGDYKTSKRKFLDEVGEFMADYLTPRQIAKFEDIFILEPDSEAHNIQHKEIKMPKKTSKKVAKKAAKEVCKKAAKKSVKAP